MSEQSITIVKYSSYNNYFCLKKELLKINFSVLLNVHPFVHYVQRTEYINNNTLRDVRINVFFEYRYVPYANNLMFLQLYIYEGNYSCTTRVLNGS